jgi:hypothetical protein
MAKQLVVRLRPDGTVDAETIGMHGPECLDHIEALEALLDAETISSQFTQDYTATAVEEPTAVEAEQTDGLR